MERILEYTINPADQGVTILDFLRDQGFSRRILSSMKEDRQAILLNGTPAFGRTILKAADHLRIRVRETEAAGRILPCPMKLDILFEDEDILILNKPADTPIHPSIGNYTNTLANGAAYYYAAKGEPFVYRCINRLDRDTTGALILAKNPLSAAILSQQMKSRQIKRTYLAVVEGPLPPKGTIRAPIARADASLIERKVDFARGENAVTHYECLETRNGYSLAELHLETGRTHQIRVHMGYIGHPLPGDYLYHPVYDRFLTLPLHSYQLEFLHPITKEPMLFTAPVPRVLKDAFEGELSPF